MMAGVTPSQTVGPFFSIGLDWPDGSYVAPEGRKDAFWIRGTVYDGAGEPVADALVETWQADAEGRFAHADDPRGAVVWEEFRGFGRSATDADGCFQVFTVKPGPVPFTDGRAQAPHVIVSVLARGLFDRVVTRLYFDDEAEANAVDPVLGLVPDESLRARLLATGDGDGYRYDIHLQGEDESVFFAI